MTDYYVRKNQDSYTPIFHIILIFSSHPQSLTEDIHDIFIMEALLYLVDYCISLVRSVDAFSSTIM